VAVVGNVRDRPLLRDARPGDGAAVARVWLEVGKYYAQLDPDAFQVPEESGLADWFEEDLQQPLPHNSRTLLAEVGDELAGWVSGHIEHPHEAASRNFVRTIGEPRLIVDVLVVTPTLWRRGIGSRLLSGLEEWARSIGATISTLDTYVHSPVSVSFYEKRMAYERRSIYFVKHLRSADA
jgi:GNAT superfamily N-acetyltransferase